MSTTFTTPMPWSNAGIEPSATLQTNGFAGGYKPPAEIFNYFLHNSETCITELQEVVTTLESFPVAVGTGADAVILNAEKQTSGGANVASGTRATAAGLGTTASGQASFSTGTDTTASGTCSSSGGWGTVAKNYQAALGKFNTPYDGPTGIADTTGSVFIIGVGTGASATANAFRVTAAGQCMGTTFFASSGADYAELFEWSDSNAEGKDRRGKFVTLDGEKIRLATADDDYILGAVSANPSAIGDAHTESWKDMYIKDVFGDRVSEEVKVPESIDDEGNIIPAHTEKRFKLNPEYDPNKKYTSRLDRPEWATVGLMGKLILVDDGTCKVNGYCKPSEYGIATASESGYRVLSRLDDTHIKILFR